ncbi:MAG: TonB-dependent receptor [Cyclobacteriaceae bacterium]
MRHILFFVFSCFHILAFGQNIPCEERVEGRVLDLENRQPLPFATVNIVGMEKGAVTDSSGYFLIEGICEQEIHLEVRFIGYKSVVHHHDTHHSSPTVYLAVDQTLLESIVVEDAEPTQIQSISVEKKEISKISLISSSIGELANELTGVNSLNTGSNISKPMIHGLHSNRVLVINNGVRHAYQVWGQEHAPEIDPSHVDQIRVVKGAGTVKYGPEALGGVILYESDKPTFDESLTGSFGTSYQTNGKAINSQLSLQQGFHRFAWNAGVYGIRQGDLHTPDYLLTNTGKQEYGGSFNTLIHQPIYDLKVSGSFFDQELGILRGSIVGNLTDLQNAIERGAPNPTDPFSYDIQNPRQTTQHGMLSTNLSLFLGEHNFNVQYALQHNNRQEYDVRRGELNNRPVIDLNMLSHNLEAEWVQPKMGDWKGHSGIQSYSQDSENVPGSNPVNFIPDYDVWNLGIYTVQSYKMNETTLELGVRLDYQSLDVADSIRDTFSYTNQVDWTNGTFTLGVAHQPNESISLFSNLGSAWRPPNAAELYSFGYHHSRVQFGLWRYNFNPQISTPINQVFDQGDRSVKAERSLKWVTGLEIRKDKFSAEFIAYANHINDFIFLRPFGVTTNIAGTFPYFIYDQTNALLLGSDWNIQINHSDVLESELKVSYVFATERGEQQAFLEIPPLDIHYAAKYSTGAFIFGVNLDYTAKQWNAPSVRNPIAFQSGNAQISQSEIFDFMSPPDGYLLVGASAEFEKKRWKIAAKADNLLNSTYRIYTDRMRYFADAPGRNFVIALEIKI